METSILGYLVSRGVGGWPTTREIATALGITTSRAYYALMNAAFDGAVSYDVSRDGQPVPYQEWRWELKSLNLLARANDDRNGE